MDNEPESYLTNWRHQPGDYAEFVATVAARIRAVEPRALIIAPSTAGGSSSVRWTEEALGLHGLTGTAAYRAARRTYSIGPWTDVVGFHIYEGLNSFLAGEDATIDRAKRDALAPFLEWHRREGSGSAANLPCWHTEGNFDFLKVSPEERRVAWRFQAFARAFAAGVSKINVMDASPLERVAVRQFIDVLPDPFPMLPASKDVEMFGGAVTAFRHTDGEAPADGQVWVMWADNGSEGADVGVDVFHDVVRIHHVDGTDETMRPADGKLRLTLPGDPDISTPIMIEDRPDGI